MRAFILVTVVALSACVLVQTAPLRASDFTIDSLAAFTYPSTGGLGGSDDWGWNAPDGTRYAIMGVKAGVAFVNVTTLSAVEVIPGPSGSCSAFWRDIKTYQHYCYAVSECVGTNEGLMIMDMAYLPDSVHFIRSIPVDPLGDVTSHNLSIDTLNGFAYLEGRNQANESIHVFSLADPENPVHVHSFGDAIGIHDITAIDDTIYVADGNAPTISVYDMAVKTAPVLLSRFTIPSAGYVHNCWPTRDHKHLVTTEETSGKTVKIWDIQDLLNVQLAGQFIGNSDIAHNALCIGDTVYLSHYAAGVEVWDISTPSTPTRLANFDTYQPGNTGFEGCWGMYPFAGDGYMYASNLDGRFFILKLVDTTAVADDDSDGVPNASDNCPNMANPTQADDDSDGVGNVCDNCPATPNPGQEDADSNGVGDACDYVCGDADSGGAVTVADAVYVINYIFAGGPAPYPLASADVDCSGTVSIGDAVAIISYIFGGGPAPCSGCP